MKFRLLTVAVLLLAGPFCFGQRLKLSVDWRLSAHASLAMDCYQTLRLPGTGYRELNPVARGFQRAAGYEAGTALYFLASHALLESAGRKAPWVYPLVCVAETFTILRNRRLRGVGGFPVIVFNCRF